MNFCFVLHNHQPVGQLPWAFEDAWRESYAPFLDVLAEYSRIKVGLHFSGPLLDWLAEHKPQTIQQIRVLIARGQIEVLCGGYYEPIFAIWPREDAQLQIEKSRGRIRELFDCEARGLWLTERVWEPHLADWFSSAGIEYSLLDSTLFEAADISEQDSFAAFSAGDSSLKFLPINRTLRELIPWREPSETIEFLRDVQETSGDDAVVVFADDGEKFGAWPGTHDWVFRQGWLAKFFEALQNAGDWLHVTTPREYLSHHAPRRSVDLPPGSYPEMQNWSGGNWRNFLERYQESRDMREEVLRTRMAIGDNRVARDHILHAQSNDAYWHGVFGGLYLKHLRQAIYEECSQTRGLTQPKTSSVQTEQHDGECFLQNEKLRIGTRKKGGHLFLLTSEIAHHNLLATLRRYREPYHDADTPCDWHARGALLDHFFGENVSLDDFCNVRYEELGDFLSEEWQIESSRSDERGVLTLQREGGVWHNGKFAPLTIHKTVTLQAGEDTLQIEYSFRNHSDEALNLWWGCEWNAVLTGSDLPDRHYHANDHKTKLDLEGGAQFEAVHNPIIADRWKQLWLEWEFAEPTAMWHVPLFTTSQKEGGHIERVYQQSCFIFHRRLQLAPQEEYSLSFQSQVTAKA